MRLQHSPMLRGQLRAIQIVERMPINIIYVWLGFIEFLVTFVKCQQGLVEDPEYKLQMYTESKLSNFRNPLSSQHRPYSISFPLKL